MTDCVTTGVGLHIAQSIDEVFCAVGLDQLYYDPLDMIFLHVALKGRPHNVESRVLNLIVNNSLAGTITLDEFVDDFMHVWVLNDSYVGNVRVDYVENGLRYWSRQFERGMCVLPSDVKRVTTDRLIHNLMKIRGQL